MLGVDPHDRLAIEFLEEVLGGEFADVSDAGEPLHEHRLLEVGLFEPLDGVLVHGATPGSVA
jgi:uncharacterized glyoxalase superfamily protein PhnB